MARHVYHSSYGGATYCPIELGARVILTATPLLAKQAAFKLGVMDSNAAISDFRQSGRKIARSYLQKIEADVASIIDEKQDYWQYVPVTEELSFGKRVKTISLGVDGTCALFCDDGYREVMVGTIALYDEDGERLHTNYVAETPEYGKETFFTKMDREIEVIRSRCPVGRCCRWSAQSLALVGREYHLAGDRLLAGDGILERGSKGHGARKESARELARRSVSSAQI